MQQIQWLATACLERKKVKIIEFPEKEEPNHMKLWWGDNINSFAAKIYNKILRIKIPRLFYALLRNKQKGFEKVLSIMYITCNMITNRLFKRNHLANIDGIASGSTNNLDLKISFLILFLIDSQEKFKSGQDKEYCLKW